MIKKLFRISNYLYVAGVAVSLVEGVAWSAVSLFTKKGERPAITDSVNHHTVTVVDSFWRDYTVIGANLNAVKTAYQSEKYLQWRFTIYPFFREFMGLDAQHENEVILDYGCGPGNDLVWFLTHTKAKKVIGIDVSEKALRFAGRRISLHQVDCSRVELIKTADSVTDIPLKSGSVDYIYCEGVLHHTSNPERIIEDFNRVLKPKGEACIMVYNEDSIFYHLLVAYDQMILQRNFQGLSVDEAFTRSTDSENCPIARSYKPEEFIAICEKVGFTCEFVGGYFSVAELTLLKKYHWRAIRDNRLAKRQRDFLQELVVENGYPFYRGKSAGIGGVYKLRKV